MFKKFSVVVIAAGLALAACSSDDSVEDANAAYCSQLSTTLSSIQALAALDPATTTVDEYQAARDTVASDIEALDAAASDLETATQAEASTAVDSYNSTLQSIPGDSSVQDAAQSAVSAAANLQGQLEAVGTQVGC